MFPWLVANPGLPHRPMPSLSGWAPHHQWRRLKKWRFSGRICHQKSLGSWNGDIFERNMYEHQWTSWYFFWGTLICILVPSSILNDLRIAGRHFLFEQPILFMERRSQRRSNQLWIWQVDDGVRSLPTLSPISWWNKSRIAHFWAFSQRMRFWLTIFFSRPLSRKVIWWVLANKLYKLKNNRICCCFNFPIWKTQRCSMAMAMCG